jgi:hypothetical protein
MLPQSVTCEECGEKAYVRAYGRIEYDWDDAADPVTAVKLRSVRLTIDCPTCGVLVQDHLPEGQQIKSPGKSPRGLIRRLKAVSAALRS